MRHAMKLITGVGACVVLTLIPFAGCLPAAAQDAVEDTIRETWEARFPGEGDMAVDVARCEGWNATAGWDPAHISVSGDAGVMQINQIHGQPGELIEGRWPGAVQTVAGNLAVAMDLRARDGWAPWARSQHCWGSPVALATTGAESGVLVLVGLVLVSLGGLMVIPRKRGYAAVTRPCR